MASEQIDLKNQESVLRAIDLPDISPAVDRTASAIARRAGLPFDEVTDILGELEARRPRLVRRVHGRGTTEFWFRSTFPPASQQSSSPAT
jgi:hypothetical protein